MIHMSLPTPGTINGTLAMFINKFLMMATARSTEEEDTLERSTKKFKDVYSVGGTYGRGLGKEAKE